VNRANAIGPFGMIRTGIMFDESRAGAETDHKGSIACDTLGVSHGSQGRR
jgi:hypothetical protein